MTQPFHDFSVSAALYSFILSIELMYLDFPWHSQLGLIWQQQQQESTELEAESGSHGSPIPRGAFIQVLFHPVSIH